MVTGRVQHGPPQGSLVCGGVVIGSAQYDTVGHVVQEQRQLACLLCTQPNGMMAAVLLQWPDNMLAVDDCLLQHG